METTAEMSTTAPPVNVSGVTPEVEAAAPPASATETPKVEKMWAGKYKTAEELEKGYLEQAKMLAAPKDGKTPESKGAILEDERMRFANELATEGKLSEETRKRMNGLGITNDMLEAHEIGMNAVKERNGLLIGYEFKSEDRYKAALEWAEANVPDETRAAILRDLWSAKSDNVKRGSKLLHTLYSAEAGREGVTRPGGGVVSAKPFQNDSEQAAAFQDSRWWDKAHPEYDEYRKAVTQRLQASIG